MPSIVLTVSEKRTETMYMHVCHTNEHEVSASQQQGRDKIKRQTVYLGNCISEKADLMPEVKS